jgi:hypothetical protein
VAQGEDPEFKPQYNTHTHTHKDAAGMETRERKYGLYVANLK